MPILFNSNINQGQQGERRRAGVTLVEVLTAMTVISVLLAASAPTALQTIEQAHADIAGINLTALWNAQRFYWLEHRSYAPDVATLQAAGLLDESFSSASRRYNFSIESADGETFHATAKRSGSKVWTGDFAIDQTGVIQGGIQKLGLKNVITLGFE